MDIRKIAAEDTWPIRHKVMWPDRAIDYIKLDMDSDGIHYGLFEDESLISAISLFVNGEKMQFRKFATLESEQGHGYGTKLLSFVIDVAIDMKIKVLWCNARANKTEFYERFSLVKTDKTFEKGGKQYVIMERILNE